MKGNRAKIAIVNHEEGFSWVTIDIPLKADAIDERPEIHVLHNPTHLHISFGIENPPSIVYPNPKSFYKDFDERVFSDWDFANFMDLNEKFDIRRQM